MEYPVSPPIMMLNVIFCQNVTKSFLSKRQFFLRSSCQKPRKLKNTSFLPL